jgi:hypothetical protein
MTGAQPATSPEEERPATHPPEEVWLGYTFNELRRIADRAAAYCRWADRLPFPERSEIAWTGIIDFLTGCDTPPQFFEVYRAAQRAIGRTSDAELREHGLRHGPDGIHATPHFEIYWTPKPAPGADVTVVDRIALWQIWVTLRPLYKVALLALAAHGDYTAAAQAIGYPYGSFGYLISQARAEFFALWHEAETPSHLWANNRHGDGDIEKRVQRTIAAKRRRMREELTD